jgi:competence protein ComEC
VVFTSLLESFNKERRQLWLYLPVIFALGVVFYINFQLQFLENILTLLLIFFTAAILAYLNRFSDRCLIYLSLALFLFGGFYSNFYQKIFLNHTKITGKIYVEGVGKIEEINKFYNPINHLEGATLLLKDPVLYQMQFFEKKTSKAQVAEKPYLKKRAKKKTKPKNFKKYENLNNYQDIDRKFFDFSSNYQNVAWLDNKGLKQFPNPPEKLLISIVKYQDDLKINNVIFLKMSLNEAKKPEFPDDFNFDLNAKAKKIGGYGYGFGEIKTIKEAQISSVEEFFIFLRQKAKEKIFKATDGDNAAIIAALLIGDQKDISNNLMKDIRGSGLAHLLSISGFHLSLMAMIFLIGSRFLLARSEHLALNYDLKKIAAIIAIIATYFYLKISGSPLPAQRSFLMVLFFLISIFVSEKINAKRVVMAALFLMTLANPYNIFNIGFQLSFAAILVLGAFYDNFGFLIKKEANQSFLTKIFYYFFAIILTSIAIQIATIPFLMYSFRNVSVLGFLANITAIPLASFFVMPIGFLALFLMPFSLEKYALIVMKWGVVLISKIASFVANLDYSFFISPQLSGLGLTLAVIGLFIICLSSSQLKFLGIIIFLSSFLTLNYVKKPDISFQSKQKFFAIYDEKNGLVFSKNLHPSKSRELWMKYFDEKKFKYINEEKQKNIICNKENCRVQIKNKSFLILNARNKIAEICNNNFDVIVNLTSRYSLPDCIEKNKIKIDNLDFYQKGGHFFYFNGDEFEVRTSY